MELLRKLSGLGSPDRSLGHSRRSSRHFRHQESSHPGGRIGVARPTSSPEFKGMQAEPLVPPTRLVYWDAEPEPRVFHRVPDTIVRACFAIAR